MPNSLEAALDYAERGFSVIPISPDLDQKGKARKNPFLQWTEFQKRRATPEEIRGWWKKWPRAMVGIVTGEISGIFVIDCDTREGYEAIQALLPEVLILPIARTPRGGWHLWFIYPTGSGITIGSGLLPGIDYRGEGGYVVAPPSTLANGKGYTWQEGLALGQVAPATVPLNIINIIYSYIGDSAKKDQRQQSTTNDNNDNKMFEFGTRDSDLFHVSNCLVKGGMPENEISQVLEKLIISWGEAPDRKWISDKIQSALKRSERREGNITAEVREWVMTTSGYFETTNCHKELQRQHRDEMKVVNIALARLCEGPDPILEKHGNRRGCYRLIDRTIEFMDFASADINNVVDLRLPLGLHRKTKIYPKGVVVIAGVSGMGKTLFALNAIARNMDRLPCFYFNSEMSAEQLKLKLTNFPIPMDQWVKGMKVVDQWDFHNIQDKIQPDALNVIDYLEPEGDKPFNIHGTISAIIRRLNKGTALIAIQKKQNSNLGTGGIYSIKAATLALALDWCKIEVVKNRNREADLDPSCNKIDFDIEHGHKFVNTGPWHK
jgi:hypothetical protein